MTIIKQIAAMIWGVWLTWKPRRGEGYIYTDGRGYLSRKALYRKAGIR